MAPLPKQKCKSTIGKLQIFRCSIPLGYGLQSDTIQRAIVPLKFELMMHWD